MPRLAALLLLAALVPAASAALTVSVDPPQATVDPESQSVALNVTVAIDCVSFLQHADPADDKLTLHLDPWSRAGLVVAGPQDQVVGGDACLAGNPDVTARFNWTAVATRQAPGLTPLLALFNVSSPTKTAAALPDLAGQGSFNLTAKPYFLVQPKVESKLVTFTGDGANASLLLTNFGNVATLVHATVLSPANASLTMPDVTLGSPYADPAGASPNGTMPIHFQAPGGAWTDVPVTLQLTLRSPQDPTATAPPLQVNLLFRNGEANANRVPNLDLGDQHSPAPAGVLLGLALLGLAARRRA